MEIATVVISAFGLLFAAAAARAAVQAVELTRDAQHEEQLRRLREALVAIAHTAAELSGHVGGGPFGEAQLELKRARQLGVVLPDGVDEILDRLEAPEAASTARVGETRQDAQRAWLTLSTQDPPPLMPRWYRRAIGTVIAYRARRTPSG